MVPIAGSTSPKKPATKLPETRSGSPTKQPSAASVSSSPYYRDVRMDTAKGLPSYDVRMNTAKAPFEPNKDIYMETARGATSTVKAGPAFQVWEKDLLESGEVKRKATVAQLCTLEFVFLLIFLFKSRGRLFRLLFPTIGLYISTQRSTCKVRPGHR